MQITIAMKRIICTKKYQGNYLIWQKNNHIWKVIKILLTTITSQLEIMNLKVLILLQSHIFPYNVYNSEKQNIFLAGSYVPYRVGYLTCGDVISCFSQYFRHNSAKATIILALSVTNLDFECSKCSQRDEKINPILFYLHWLFRKVNLKNNNENYYQIFHSNNFTLLKYLW